jgi:hypothetical protein
VNELMMLVIAEVTPLTIVWKVLVVVAKELESIIDEVAVIPLTTEVTVFEAVLNRLVVVEVSPESEVVALTPLIVVVSILVAVAKEEELLLIKLVVVVEITPLTLLVIIKLLVEVASKILLFDITLDVATIPFTVMVNVLPESEVERELMMLVKSDETPLTMV